jgi:peptidoglycan/xylan/chitin deacetylase (PgdA/CDA1 family)
MKTYSGGQLIISLDLELMWGCLGWTIENYGKNIEAVHQVIPRLLETFRKFNVKATFATVGFLFCETKQELLESVPANKPHYSDDNLSPYNGYFDTIGADFNTDKYHFAPDLLKLIRQYPEHEIGTHTFSHYYCLEPGQTVDTFKADLQSAIKIAKKWGITLSALVFPRNQFNDDYLRICKDLGITYYRGNQYSWLYSAKNKGDETSFRRALRLLDAYINISGYNCYTDEQLQGKFPVDIPASRFLRPYSKKLQLFEGLRLRRIKSDMAYAAKHNMTYHLWWHPHNFGTNEDENFAVLEKIFGHYNGLNQRYGFQSYTMSGLAEKILT